MFLLSGFERLLDVGHTQREMVEGLGQAFQRQQPVLVTACQRTATRSWGRTVQTVADAWLADFVNLRGSLAHGNSVGKYPSAWSIHEHLPLGSLLFPLLLKQRLEKHGPYSLTEDDTDSANAFEKLVCLASALGSEKQKNGSEVLPGVRRSLQRQTNAALERPWKSSNRRPEPMTPTWSRNLPESWVHLGSESARMS